MAHTPTQSGDAKQPGKNRGQPQPDSLENDDRGTKPYQKQSQRQTQWQEHRENPEKGDPNVIGDPPPDEDDTIRADDDEVKRDEGVVEDSDPPLPTDDGGELGSSSERH
jgi:hypothetical protein